MAISMALALAGDVGGVGVTRWRQNGTDRERDGWLAFCRSESEIGWRGGIESGWWGENENARQDEKTLRKTSTEIEKNE
jgi:hypothetical protein